MTTNEIPPQVAPKKPEKLFTFASGGWVVLLALLMTIAAALWILWPAIKSGFQSAIGDGVHVESYKFDLSNLKVPRERLAAAGVSKDAVRAIVPDEVETMSPAEIADDQKQKHRKIVVDSDRVIGVVINGAARAYPLRVLVQHEICNDEVKGLPIAVTYSPLCDSAVVFDRRADGAIREFHNSGLIVNGAPLYYDKQQDTTKESLWGQLQFQAIAGPLAGTALKRIDYALATWGEWKTAYPETRICIGVGRLRDNKIYDKEPYQTYFKSNTPRFEPVPKWSKQGVPMMTPIMAEQNAEGKWIIKPAESSATITPAIRSFVFAWYGAYPDSDFSALGK